MGFSWKAILENVGAPLLAAALPGPLGNAAASALSSALGMKPDATVTQVQQQLASGGLTGDQMIAIKNAENQFQMQMEQAKLDSVQKLEALAQQDRDSARKREVEVKDATPRILAYAVTAGFFGILAFMFYKPVPEMAHDVLLVMLGSLGTAWTAIIAYYFGSSSGDAAKTDLLAKAPAITNQK